MKSGHIILVEDDIDDQDFITDVLKLLGITNEVKIFENGQLALDFLRVTTVQPFIIISDVNLPIMNGLQLKREIQGDEYLRVKAIPFIFLSTSADMRSVSQAFDLNVQGFFVKESSYEGIQKQLRLIVDYWQNCRHPNFKE